MLQSGFIFYFLAKLQIFFSKVSKQGGGGDILKLSPEQKKNITTIKKCQLGKKSLSLKCQECKKRKEEIKVKFLF